MLALPVVTLVPTLASATPSTTFWAPSVATCQAYATPHVTYDSYFGKPGGYPVDTGVTMGVSPSSKIQAEVGYDAFLPSSNPVGFYLNGKVCAPESAFAKGMPGIGVGIYNVGFHGDVNNYNTFYAVAQKTLSFGGFVSGGYYRGLGPDVLYTNSDGDVAKQGAIVGWSSPDIKVGITGLSKITIIGDVQTGKNVLGGGGMGATVYFNDYIDLIVGPVFYFDKHLQPGGASHLWTTQLDVDIPLGKKK